MVLGCCEGRLERVSCHVVDCGGRLLCPRASRDCAQETPVGSIVALEGGRYCRFLVAVQRFGIIPALLYGAFVAPSAASVEEGQVEIAVVTPRPRSGPPGSATELEHLDLAVSLERELERELERLGPSLVLADQKDILRRAGFYFRVSVFECHDGVPCILDLLGPLRGSSVHLALVSSFDVSEEGKSRLDLVLYDISRTRVARRATVWLADLSERRRAAEISRALKELLPKETGRIEISASPPPTELLVGTRSIEFGSGTRRSVDDLPVGTHRLYAVAPGKEPFRTAIEVKPDASTRVLIDWKSLEGKAATDPAPVAGPHQQRPRYSALRVRRGSLRVDGRLDESPWLSAPKSEQFYNIRSTPPWAPADERTRFSILYDESGLTLGIWADHQSKETMRPIVHPRWYERSDYVCVVVDVGATGETARELCVSSSSQVSMGQLFQRGRLYQRWVGVAYARAHIHESGWTAEVSLPWSSLGVSSADALNVGLLVVRSIPALNQEVLSNTNDLGLTNHLPTIGVFSVRDVEPDSGIQLTLRPFVQIASPASDYPFWTDYSGSGDGIRARLSADLRIPVGKRGLLQLTFDPDFSETPVDQFVVNLQRFLFFFPERREFFTEQSDLFMFGVPARAQLFQSRTIGLEPVGRGSSVETASEVPLLGGVRLISKGDPFSVGILSMQSTSRTSSGNIGDSVDVNFSVVRPVLQLEQSLQLGAMFTQRAFFGRNRDSASRSYGVDATYFSNSGRLISYAYVALTESPDIDYSAHVDFQWNSQVLKAKMSYTYTGEDFFPALGFFPFVGAQDMGAHLEYAPMIGTDGILKAYIRILGELIADLDSRPFSSSTSAVLGFELFSLASWEIALHENTDRLFAPFSPLSGTVYAAGDYRARSVSVAVRSSPRSAIGGSLEYIHGEFLSGTRQQLQASLNISSGALSADVRYIVPRLTSPSEDVDGNGLLDPLEDLDGDGTLDAGRATNHVAGVNVSFLPSAHLTLTGGIQVAREPNRAAVQLVTKYEYLPRQFIYLVVLQRSRRDQIISNEFDERLVMSKLEYRFGL